MNTTDFMLKLPTLSKTRKQLLTRLAPYLIILLVSLVFFYPVWLQNKVPLPLDALVGAHTPWIEVSWPGYPAGVPIKNQEITDAISQFYPWRSLVGRFWRAGKAPLWNQYMFAGTPFLAALHSAGLYPLNAVYLLLTDVNAWTALVFLQIFLAGIFTYLFLSGLKLDKWAGVLGAVSFMFSGYMIAWLEFATGGHAGLWLPLLLFLELKHLQTRKLRYFLFIPVVFALIYTAGDFQVPLYTTLTYFAFAAYYSRSKKMAVKRLVWPVVAFILGTGLALPQILPTVELFGRSIRAADPYIKEYFYGLFHWEKSVLFIWPDFFGNVVTRNYWGKYGFHEYMAYVGVIGLVFATFSLFTKKSNLEKFFWLILGLCLLFLYPTPIAFLPYNLKIPGLGTSSASRLLFLVGFCLSVLSAYGFSKWQKINGTKLMKVVLYYLAISAGVGLGVFACVYYFTQGGGQDLQVTTNLKVALKNMIPTTAVLAAMLICMTFANFKRFAKAKNLLAVALVTLAVADMLRFAWKNTPFSPREFLFPTTQTIDYLTHQEEPFRMAGSGIPLNYFMQYGISSTEGYDPIYPHNLAEWYSLVNFGTAKNPAGRYGEVSNFNSGLLNFANVRYIVDYKKDPSSKAVSDKGVFATGVESARYQAVLEEGRVFVFENKEALPKVWLTQDYVVANDEKDLHEQVVLNQDTPKVILTQDPAVNRSADGVSYEISDFVQDLNLISFTVKADDEALVFLSESYFPGWQAYVNGKKENVIEANYIFQALPIAPGEHSVKFIYNPASFRIGVAVASAAAVSMLLLAGYGLIRRRVYL